MLDAEHVDCSLALRTQSCFSRYPLGNRRQSKQPKSVPSATQVDHTDSLYCHKLSYCRCPCCQNCIVIVTPFACFHTVLLSLSHCL